MEGHHCPQSHLEKLLGPVEITCSERWRARAPLGFAGWKNRECQIVLPRSKVKEVLAETYAGFTEDTLGEWKQLTSDIGTTVYTRGTTLRGGANSAITEQQAKVPEPEAEAWCTSKTSGHHSKVSTSTLQDPPGERERKSIPPDYNQLLHQVGGDTQHLRSINSGGCPSDQECPGPELRIPAHVIALRAPGNKEDGPPLYTRS
jgi:hypothetical protein